METALPLLPADIGAREFDTLHDDPPAWRGAVQALAATLGADPARLRQEHAGTVLVARLGDGRVLKLYPPFLRDHFEFERATLATLQGRLSLPTPRLLDSGEHGGWPFVVMDELHGERLDLQWPALRETQRLALLRRLGALTSEVHALAADPVRPFAPRWPEFLACQREHCLLRQQRTGLPAHLLAQLQAFVAGPVPEGPDVLLTGEYTPFNLLVRRGRLSAMFDFGDGLVGPAPYDWLGPLCFLAAGSAARVAAFMDAAGVVLDAGLRLQLLRLLLLHRYSHLTAQIACPGWQEAADFEALAARIWPLADGS